MALEQTFSFGADVSAGIAGVEAVVNAVNKAGVAIKEVTAAAVTLEKATKKGIIPKTLNFEGILENGEKVKGVLRDVGKGYQFVKETISDNTAATDAAFKKQIDAIKAVNRAQAENAEKQKAAEDKKRANIFTTTENIKAALNKQIEAEKKAEEQRVKGLERAKTAARGFLLTLEDVARISEATVVKQIIGGVSNLFQDAARDALKFQIAISEIRTISQENQLAFSQWGTELTKVSNLLGLPIADVAEANYEALSNQIVKGAESFEFLARAGDFARTTQSTLTQSVNLLSSAFNAYNISTADAERVSAIFFKTIDLGRLRSAEIADTFGRVAFLGNTLGVTFEEVNAGLATLTIQGVKASDAQTLLVNIFQKLLRPTERMKAVFKELGVANGEAAVKTFGFANLMQRLIDLAKQGDVDVGELFNEIRGRKGFEGLANFQGQFAGTLDKITNSIGDYRKAVEIRGESPADFLVKEFNKVKNTLNQSFAQPAIEGIADLVKKAKEAGPEFNTLKSGVEEGTKAMLALTAASLAAALASRGLTAALAVNPFILAATAVGYLTLKIYELKKGTTDYGETLQRLREEMKAEKLQDLVGGGGENRFNQLKVRGEETFRTIQQSVAQARTGIDANLDRIRAKTATINDTLKNQFKSYFETLNDGIQETERKISTARATIKSSKDAVQEFSAYTKEIVFQSKFEFATPAQQRQLIAKQINDLEQEAVNLANKVESDPQRAAENEKQVNENLKKAAALVAEDQRILVEMRKAAAQANGYSGPIIVDSLENNRRLNEIKQTQIKLNEQIQKQEDDRRKKLIEDKAREEDRLAQLRRVAEEFTDFNFLNKDGNVKSEFRDPLSGQLDPQKALGKFNEITGRLRDLIGADSAAQINLLNVVEAKKTTILRDAEATRLKTVLDTQRQNLENQRKFSEDQIKIERERAQKASSATFGQGGTLETLGKTEDLSKIAKSLGGTKLDATLAVIKDVAGGLTGGDNSRFGNLQNAVDAGAVLEQNIAKFKEALKLAKENTEDVNGFKVITADNLKLLRVLSDRVQASLKLAIEAKFGKDADVNTLGLRPSDGGETVPFGRLNTDLSKQVDNLEQQRRETIFGARVSQDNQEKLANLENDPLILRLKELKAQIPGIGAAVDEAAPKIQTKFIDINEAIKSTVESLKQMNLELEKAGNMPLGTKKIAFDPEADAGYFAKGGVIGLHPGSPRGTDTVPAWLTPGERVLSVAQNRQYERLATMLRPLAAQPRYYSQGGSVTTTVGDIHIAVPGVNSVNTLNQIGSQLQRAIKRGRIKLAR